MRAGAGLLLGALLVAGCAGASSPEPNEPAPGTTWPRGVHPWPAGDEWPTGLVGPFKVKGVEELKIKSFDGILMDGWIVKPDVPDGTRVPVVLWTAPYFGQCAWMPPTSVQAATTDYPSCHYATGDDPELWDNDQVSESVPVKFLVENGYAVAIFNVRGTGNTGGCFEWFGPNEQRDQAVLVEWLGAQPWSNGRVGMMGLSYHGTTPWEAAIQNPPSLKTIVVAGMVSDAYTFSHTPQGAVFTTIGVFEGHFYWRVSGSPPLKGGAQHATVEHAGVLPERTCAETVTTLKEEFEGTGTDIRNKAYWDARRLIDKFPGVTASVFLTHGFQDHWGSGHQQQENAAWASLPLAPKRQLEGQWGHEFPNFNAIRPEWKLEDWNARLLEWLDFWLKGIGDAPPREGIVDYQDAKGEWHEAAAWPPVESHAEVLYLTEGRLQPAPGTGSRSFRSVPIEGNPYDALCPPGPGPATGVPFVSEPVAERVFIAGNPMAFLRITSDLPGGLVAVHLVDLGPDFRCGSNGAQGHRRLAAGVADLRFHEGNFQGKDFRTGAPVNLRIDIVDLADVLEPGHRLAAILSYGDPIDRTSQPIYPTIQVHADGNEAASHVVIPVVNGTFGGAPPTVSYPPRPFVPAASP